MEICSKSTIVFLFLLVGVQSEAKSFFHVQAHRGASGQLLENTIPAVLEAARVGSHCIEIDVHLSKDNQWVVFHDFVLEQGCCYLKDRKETNKEDILIVGNSAKDITQYKVLPGFSKRMNAPLSGARNRDYPLPLLQEMVDEVKKLEKKIGSRVVLDIEIKSNEKHPKESAAPQLLAQMMNDFLVRNGVVEQYLVRSFDLRVLRGLQRINPKVRLAVLSRKNVLDFVGHSKGINAEILAPDARVLSSEKIKLAQSKGFKVIPWTVNDPGLIAKLQRIGVDGITTDHPERVLKQAASFK